MDAPETGWRAVERWDEAVPLLAALVELESGREYTRSDVAEAADLSMKTLYLAETLDAFVDLGVLDRVDGDETRYVLDGDSRVLSAAREFDDAVARRLSEAGAE
jgi:hypothetical protein